jgi:hypothetical protein
LERAKGIEPSYAAWEAAVLPLNYARKNRDFLIDFPWKFAWEHPSRIVPGKFASKIIVGRPDVKARYRPTFKNATPHGFVAR